MSHNSKIERVAFIDRACHWTLVICFILTALSGLSLFFPSLTILSYTFGNPLLGRILHPFFGVLVFLLLMLMLLRFYRYNFLVRADIHWFKNIPTVMKGREHEVFASDKYNPGQKVMFWALMFFALVMLISGIIIWRPYFAQLFPISIIRAALLIHASVGILFIITIIMHAYMAFWVKGSIKGMIEGTVSHRWAKRHHGAWYKKMINKKHSLEENHK